MNIGPREQRKRLVMGVVMLALGAGSAVALVAAGAPVSWRLGLFLPFWVAGLGVFQARAKT